MRRLITLAIFSTILSFSTATGADEDSLDTAIRQLSDHMMSLGSLTAIQNQMNRKGRSDAELRSALVQAFESLAECTVNAVVAQAKRQNLPATPVLRVMSGIYNGPEDVESADEIKTIQSFDFGAMEPAKKACQAKFMDEVDTRVKAVEP